MSFPAPPPFIFVYIVTLANTNILLPARMNYYYCGDPSNNFIRNNLSFCVAVDVEVVVLFAIPSTYLTNYTL